MLKYFSFILITILMSCSSETKDKTIYDIVIENARVIDPETKLDKVLNVAISNDKIAKISNEKLTGAKIINATGKILSPGFIDLHAHGQTNIENRYQAFDGVTTALELEVGVDTLENWFSSRKNNAILNYGASACQLAYRNKVIANSDRTYPTIFEELQDSTAQLTLPKNKFSALRQKLTDAISKGAIGIGIPVGYLPKASIEEISDVYALAGTLNVPVFSHVREGGSIAFQQAISDAILNKTQLHICHINSMARKDIDFCLEQVEKAQNLGYPITTELYPYTAGNTEIGSAVFNEGWQERLGCSHNDLQWVETNERLTEETFKVYRQMGGSVIVHMMKEAWIKKAMKSNITMIASDGGGYSPSGHPRSSGTFTKVLRKYVKEDSLITLQTAIKKMTIMPAKVIESIVPDMKLRARIQEGCYADLLLFDLEKVKDNSDYRKGFVTSSGMDYVIINGKILIENGKFHDTIFPGRAIKSELKHN